MQVIIMIITHYTSRLQPPRRCVVDAGMKANSLDSGAPLVDQHPDIIYNSGGDEHGILKPAGDWKVSVPLLYSC